MKKEFRLRKNEDFQRIIDKKKNLANASFAAYFVKNGKDTPRIGISVSSKLGNAVIRNKIKRQVRMMVDGIIDKKSGIDLVFIVRKGYLTRKYADNLNEMIRLYDKIVKESNKEV